MMPVRKDRSHVATHSFSRIYGLIVATTVASLLLTVSWATAPGVTAQATPTTGTGEQYTPLLAAVSTPPRWFTGSDGQIHLVYELLLTNTFPVPVTVTSIDVLDFIIDRPVEMLAGAELTAATSLLASPGEPTATLPPSTIGVVWFDVTLAAPAEIPATVAHRLTVSLPPGLPVPETVSYTTGAIAVDLRPPVVIGPPLLGPGWAAVGSCCNGPHRRAFQPLDGGLYLSQRFAIDFNLLDAEGRIVSGDPSRNESYPTFGQTAIAVADATVIAARDGLPDQVPNDPKDVTVETGHGNYVVLDLGDGRYAFYAHLKSGSVAVQAGDVVRRGQRIGDVGNTGSSSGPHLHFHVMDGPSALEADGLPYVFDAFDLAGQTPPIEEFIRLADAGEPVPIDSTAAGPRSDALPIGRDVVDFPEAAATG